MGVCSKFEDARGFAGIGRNVKIDLVTDAIRTQRVDGAMAPVDGNSRLELCEYLGDRFDVDHIFEPRTAVAVELQAYIRADMNNAPTFKSEMTDQADGMTHRANQQRWVGIKSEMAAGKFCQLPLDLVFQLSSHFGPTGDDMFNSDLWNRLNKTVVVLQHSKPKDGEAIY
jgi:hypothetical protein